MGTQLHQNQAGQPSKNGGWWAAAVGNDAHGFTLAVPVAVTVVHHGAEIVVRRLSNAGRFSVTLADSAHTDESQFPRTLGELSETSDSSAIGDIYASQFYPQPEGWTLFIATTSTMSTGTGPGRSLAGSDQQAAQP